MKQNGPSDQEQTWPRLVLLTAPARKGRGMKNGSQLLIWCALLSVFTGCICMARAQDCPTSADEIATDRPDVTNSSLVVPTGSLQAENEVDWSVRHAANSLDASNTRLRAGIAHCTEFLIDIPIYFGSLNGSQSSGFSNIVVSFKRQLPVPFGFDLSATAGMGFPSGSGNISAPGYQPYIQFPWFVIGQSCVIRTLLEIGSSQGGKPFARRSFASPNSGTSDDRQLLSMKSFTVSSWVIHKRFRSRQLV
ncbi:MAG: hypothetical protein JOZ29_06965 [Deltaproteobacteria bacterium]|nr:hypothetical protein [Deltaproteobacteria bacterium]